MAKTLPDLRIVASQIKEATLHGENTADRVGGLLVDLVDYLDTLHIDEVTLGPLLTALNNSNLIDPSDGQTLTFSVIEDNWTFSSAITQLKIAQGRIEMNVASNYQYLLDTKTLLQGELDEADQRIRDNYAEYATWRDQTDTYIAQYATAYDEEGNLVAMSTIMQTADEVKMEVKDLETKITNIADPESWEQGTTSAEASGKTYNETKVDDTKAVRIGNLLPVTQDAYLTFTPTDNNYAVQVLYFNKDKVYCTSATHWRTNWTLLSEVEEGKLKIINQTDVQYIAIKLRKGDGSTAITVDDVKNAGLSLATSNVTAYSEFKQTADEIRQTVTDNKDAADEAFDNINNTVIPGLEDEIGGVRDTANSSATWITNNKDRIALVAAQFDENGNLINTTGLVIEADFATLFAQEVDEQGIVHKADLSVYVKHDEDGNIVTGIRMNADQIDMTTNRLNVWAQSFHLNAEYLDVTAAVFKGWFTSADIHSQDITFDTETFTLISEKVNITSGQITFKAETDYSVIAQNIRLDAIQIDMTTDVLNTWAGTYNLHADLVNWSVGNYIINGNHLEFTASNYASIKTGIGLSDYLETTTFNVFADGISADVSALQEHREDLTNIGAWEQGGIDISSPGSKNNYDDFKSSSSKRIRTKELIPISKGDVISINMDASYSVELLFFNKNKKVARPASGAIVHVDWVDLAQQEDHKYAILDSTFSVGYGTSYVAIVLKINDTTDITVDSIPTSGISIIQQKLVTSGQIGLFITEDEAGNLISNARIQADHIDMTSTVLNNWASTYNLKADNLNWKISNAWKITNANDQVILYMDSLGNMNISGKLQQCEVMDDIQVGDSDCRIYIRPIGENNGAELVGMNNTDKVFSLGFKANSQSMTQASLNMLGTSKATNLSQITTIMPAQMDVYYDYEHLHTNGASVNIRATSVDTGIELRSKFNIMHFDISNSSGTERLVFGGSINLWTTASADGYAGAAGVNVGEVYVDSTNGYLRVRRT